MAVDRFSQFTDDELNLIWEALSSYDTSGRPPVEERVNKLFKEAAEQRRVRNREKARERAL